MRLRAVREVRVQSKRTSIRVAAPPARQDEARLGCEKSKTAERSASCSCEESAEHPAAQRLSLRPSLLENLAKCSVRPRLWLDPAGIRHDLPSIHQRAALGTCSSPLAKAVRPVEEIQLEQILLLRSGKNRNIPSASRSVKQVATIGFEKNKISNYNV